MKVLSIPLLVHDSSISIFDDNELTNYIMEERLSRKKHDYFFKESLNNINVTKFDKIIVVKHSFHGYYHPLDDVLKILNNFEGNVHIEEELHHIYHAYCGFYNSNFSEALCFSLDGVGANLINRGIELESVYHFCKGKVEKELYKRTRKFQYFQDANSFDEHYSNIPYDDLTVGEKFGVRSSKMDMNMLDGPGKIMGLAQYKNYKEKLQYPYNTKKWKQRVDDAHILQQETQTHVLELIKKYTQDTGIKNVVISGGYGLNCVANYHYLKHLKNINLFIDPVCFDAGISIGAAYYHSENKDNIKPLSNVYIGHQEKNYDLSNLRTKKVSYNDIVDILLQKNVVALFQGKSEAGQRALGNRSLLFDPRIINGKDIVNQIKKRENFRPFAGTILQEEAHKWFNMLSLKESPYMQYAIDACENAIEQVPAIIHADNTCRIQTVTYEQNKYFYNLISCFYDRTKVPMLMNTSFNLGGEPLVETFDHAIHTLKNSMIEYLYLPEIETLVTVKNKKLSYQ